jgi:hypothetical protein
MRSALTLLSVVLAFSQISHADESQVGKDSYVEVDGQAGFFSGVRAKGFIADTGGVKLAIEGMYGSSAFSRYDVYQTTWGLGARGEWTVDSGPSHSWILAPGLDVYYLPEDKKTSSGDSLDNDFFTGLFGVAPSPQFAISPNIDAQWLLAMASHLDLVVGIRAGISIVVTPVNAGYTSPDAKVYPDVGLFVGLRF